MITTRGIAITLTYVVSGVAFVSLYDIADRLYYLVFGLMFLLGVVNDLRYRKYVPRTVLNFSGLLVSFLFLLELSFENLIEPFANMLLLLLVIKSFEEKKPRDMYQMLLLSLFSVAVSTTFRLDLGFMVFFLLELFLGSVAFMFINLYSNAGDRPVRFIFVRKYSRFALAFPIIIAFVSVPFFFILPRTHAPLFDIFHRGQPTLTSGIANEVELNKVGEIQIDNSVVMRVYGNIPPEPYWRVSVFDTFLGSRWVRTVNRLEVPRVSRDGELVSYTVILEPTYANYLPVMDYPMRLIRIEGVRTRIKRFKGGFYETLDPINKPVRYVAVSSSGVPVDPPDPIYLTVPEDVPPSVLSLAEELSAGKRDDMEKVNALVEFFKNGFGYTLKLEDPGQDPIETFLFKTKMGNCEYFASSTALLLRLMGIPSRVVGGFKGAIKNEYGNYYIVTNSMAHVWVEAYVDGRWLRLDTTPPYISPSVRRISKIDLIRDAIVSFWYENVVDFSAQKQVSIVKTLSKSIRDVSFEDLKDAIRPVFGVVIPIIFVGFVMHFYLNNLRRTPSNLYKRLLRRLEKLQGLDLSDKLPEQVISSTKDTPYHKEVKFIVGIYQRYRFSDHPPSKEEIEEAYRVLRKIH